MTEYPPRKIGKMNRSFNNRWYKDNDWLECSIEKEAVFCLPCYLCYNGTSNSAFVIEGFRCWNLKNKLNTHVGELNSHHRNCAKACANLMKKNQSIESSFVKHSTKAEADYLVRVFLVRGGIAFMAHNEGEHSIYKGHFLEFIEALGRNNEKIAEAFKSGGGNFEEIGDGFFSVLVDESGDCSGKEQMAVVVRFIDDRGLIVERFIGIVHVEDTSVKALKDALETLLSGFGLCISKIRGQGYDGASNMKGQFGGLKTLIQKENPQAYYVHCFAHQLQLALVSMARKHEDVYWFFLEVSRIVNFLRSSNKRQSLLRKKQVAHFANLIEDELVETGTGLNQELSIERAGDTRLVDLFTPIIEVLEDLKSDRYSKGEPKSLLFVMQTFGFVFMLHLMVEVLSLTNDLSQALQKGDQDIVTDMQLVQTPLLTNLNYFKNDCFLHVIDFIMKELGDRFTPKNVELLNCVACLNPYSSFQDFDIKSLVRLTRFYPNNFEDVSDKELSSQLETYIECVKMDDNFSKLKVISDLCRTLVCIKKHKTFGFVYTLLKLALSLPVATASVERVFSGMQYVKNELRNRMENSWLNNCLVAFVEKEVFITVDDLDIIKHF
ncbi:hypothetical protein ABFS83_08G088200 [Erythranthe nasuta]